VLTAQLEQGRSSPVIGTWKIGFDKERKAFVFDKCENEGYCEERPAVFAVNGELLDPGGPLWG
jgi:hypothetical protein